jgi:hypothetical protein
LVADKRLMLFRFATQRFAAGARMDRNRVSDAWDENDVPRPVAAGGSP